MKQPLHGKSHTDLGGVLGPFLQPVLALLDSCLRGRQRFSGKAVGQGDSYEGRFHRRSVPSGQSVML